MLQKKAYVQKLTFPILQVGFFLQIKGESVSYLIFLPKRPSFPSVRVNRVKMR